MEAVPEPPLQPDPPLVDPAAAEEAAQHDQAVLLAPVIDPRLLPVKPDPFYGKGGKKEDVTAWLYGLEVFFMLATIPAATRIPFAVALLKGAALSWWRSLHLAGNLPVTWDEVNGDGFKKRITETFQSVNPVRAARDQLARMRQTGSVSGYAAAFRNTALEIPGITDDEKKDRFIRGLKQRTQEEVTIRDPSTFEEAVRIAERYDAATFSLQRQTFGSTHSNGQRSGAQRYGGNQRNTGNSGPTPMELGAMQQAQPARSYAEVAGNKQRIQRLQDSPALRMQLIKEGKCFYCREHGHMALSCPKKKTAAADRAPNGQRQ